MKFFYYPKVSWIWNNNFITFAELCHTIQCDLTLELIQNKRIKFIVTIDYYNYPSEDVTPFLLYTRGESILNILTPYYNHWLKQSIDKRSKIKGVSVVTTKYL